MFPLDKPMSTLGRHGDEDLVISEDTVSGAHARLRWQQGAWIVEDQESENGSYTDRSYERQARITLVHGSEVQIGACRLKLALSFAADSPLHRRARRVHLGKHDGLIGLLGREPPAEGDRRGRPAFAWRMVSRCRSRSVATRSAARARGHAPASASSLALHATPPSGALEITETMQPSLAPIVAGRSGPLGSRSRWWV